MIFKGGASASASAGAAEDDFIVSASGTSESAGGIVSCVAVGLRAFSLEETRIISGRAILQKRPGAAILRCIESSTGALTSVGHPQCCRALGIYVAAALDSFALGPGWYNCHRQVESIDERDVIEVEILVLIQCVFGQSGGDASPSLTV